MQQSARSSIVCKASRAASLRRSQILLLARLTRAGLGKLRTVATCHVIEFALAGCRRGAVDPEAGCPPGLLSQGDMQNAQTVAW